MTYSVKVWFDDGTTTMLPSASLDKLTRSLMRVNGKTFKLEIMNEHKTIGEARALIAYYKSNELNDDNADMVKDELAIAYDAIHRLTELNKKLKSDNVDLHIKINELSTEYNLSDTELYIKYVKIKSSGMSMNSNDIEFVDKLEATVRLLNQD